MVSIIIGSESDLPIVQKAVTVLKDFGVKYDVQIISAHRSPHQLKEYVGKAQTSGAKVFIGAAGKAAHLPGVIASYTVLPVIGLPIKTKGLGGLDALLSIVQMPKGVPVATVAINGGENAALLAIQILAIQEEELKEKLCENRKQMASKIKETNLNLKELLK